MTNRTYHHGNLRQELIEAALRLIERKGVNNFSLREAAREAGVASSAPYRHFKDRAQLLTAIAEIALQELLQQTEEAIAGIDTDDPLAQYRAAGVAYVVYAATHPAKFVVLHDTAHTHPEDSPTLKAYHDRSAALINDVLERIETPHIDRQALELTASTLMYGLARRFVDGHLDGNEYGPEDARRLAILVTEVLGVGLAGSSLHTG